MTTHDDQHAASLSYEQRSEIHRTVLRWMLLPFLMAVLSIGFMLNEQLQTSHQIEMDTVRSELSDIDHRIKQEECLIRPFRQIIRRDPAVPTREAAEFCDPDEAVPDLMARRGQLDQRLREMGGYEVREWPTG